MNETLQTTDFLFAKMKKLYPNFTRPDEIDVSVWVDILNGYSQTDILDALKNYRKNVPYNVAPLPAKFKEYLPEKHKHLETETTAQAAKGDFAWERMQQDIQAGNCRNNLYIYRDAVNIVIMDWLRQEIPTEVWQRMSAPSREKVALDKGLFNNFDEALRLAAQARFGRDCEYQSENDNKALKEMRHTSVINASERGGGLRALKSHFGVAV